MTQDHSLDRLFQPQSVAVIGASPVPGNSRNALLRVLFKHGFSGRVYPVTPTHSEVEGLKAYKRVADLPETPDVALVITPAKTVPAILEECCVKGTRTPPAGVDALVSAAVSLLRVVDALIVASAEGAKDKVPVGGSSDSSGLK